MNNFLKAGQQRLPEKFAENQAPIISGSLVSVNPPGGNLGLTAVKLRAVVVQKAKAVPLRQLTLGIICFLHLVGVVKS
jgi:hypothetical protein